jgi:hypothetical protein
VKASHLVDDTLSGALNTAGSACSSRSLSETLLGDKVREDDCVLRDFRRHSRAANASEERSRAHITVFSYITCSPLAFATGVTQIVPLRSSHPVSFEQLFDMNKDLGSVATKTVHLRVFLPK